MQEMLCEDCIRMHVFIPLEENQDLHWDNKIGKKTSDSGNKTIALGAYKRKI